MADQHPKKRYFTLRFKLILILLVVSVLVIIYTAVSSFLLASGEVENISLQLSDQYAAAAGKALSEMTELLVNQTDELTTLRSLHDLSKLPVPAASPRFMSYNREVSNAIGALSKGYARQAGFDFVSVYLTNGYSSKLAYSVTMPFTNYDQCLDYFADRGVSLPRDGYTSGTWSSCEINNKTQKAVVYLRFIYEELTLNKVGIAVFGLSDTSFSQIYASYAPNSFVTTTYGSILSASNQDLADDSTVLVEDLLDASRKANGAKANLNYTDSGGKKRIATCYPIFQMRAYLIAPFEYYEGIRSQELRGYVRSMIVVGVVGLFVAFMLEYILSAGLARSTVSLADFLAGVEHGKRGVRYRVQSNDEIGMIGDKINEMLEQIEHVSDQKEKTLRDKQQMELQIMQQQINPHLLYNTLDSVLWVLQQQRYEEAGSLLSALSEFFKISLSKGRSMIPLHEELQLIENYRIIQHLARQKDIRITCEVPEELLEYPIMKLTLQPLVENSIIHGFSGYRDDGEISICASHTDDDVFITVTDNGIGMLEDEIEEVNRVLALPERPEEFQHFGMYNISRRIAQYYGEQYGLRVESELSLYTKVIMRLPYRQSSMEQEQQHV